MRIYEKIITMYMILQRLVLLLFSLMPSAYGIEFHLLPGVSGDLREFWGIKQMGTGQLLLAHIYGASTQEQAMIIILGLISRMHDLIKTEQLPSTLEAALAQLPANTEALEVKLKNAKIAQNKLIHHLSSINTESDKQLINNKQLISNLIITLINYVNFYEWQMACLKYEPTKTHYSKLAKAKIKTKHGNGISSSNLLSIMSNYSYYKRYTNSARTRNIIFSQTKSLTETCYGQPYAKHIAVALQNIVLAMQPSGSRPDYHKPIQTIKLKQHDPLLWVGDTNTDDDYEDYGLWAFVIGSYLKLLDPANTWCSQSAIAIDQAVTFWELYPIHKRLEWQIETPNLPTIDDSLKTTILENPFKYLLKCLAETLKGYDCTKELAIEIYKMLENVNLLDAQPKGQHDVDTILSNNLRQV